MSALSGGSCWHCGQSLSPSDYGRSDTCSKCGRDTRVCKGCEFFDPQANRQCKEPQADLVVDKERSNFCDYFRPSQKVGASGSIPSRESLKASAEALFKKK